MTGALIGVERGNRFHFDASSRSNVASLPEDFADWLMDEDRDEEAREFLARVEQYEMHADEPDVDEILSMMDEYAEVHEVNAAMGFTPEVNYMESYAVVREMERTEEVWSDDEPLSWDREAELVKQAISDMGVPAPVDLDKPEYPTKVYVRSRMRVEQIFAETLLSLARDGFREAVRDLVQTMDAYIRTQVRTDEEIFRLLWSYAEIVVED